MATGKNIKIVGSADKKKHDNKKGSSRDSVTSIRCGNAANRQAATFMLLAGKSLTPITPITFSSKTVLHLAALSS